MTHRWLSRILGGAAAFLLSALAVLALANSGMLRHAPVLAQQCSQERHSCDSNTPCCGTLRCNGGSCCIASGSACNAKSLCCTRQSCGPNGACP